MLINIQTGWMKCVACSDYKRKPGTMWLGGNDFIACPVCNGSGQVARIKQLDPTTGREIDYELFNKGAHHGT